MYGTSSRHGEPERWHVVASSAHVWHALRRTWAMRSNASTSSSCALTVHTRSHTHTHKHTHRHRHKHKHTHTHTHTNTNTYTSNESPRNADGVRRTGRDCSCDTRRDEQSAVRQRQRERRGAVAHTRSAWLHAAAQSRRTQTRGGSATVAEGGSVTAYHPLACLWGWPPTPATIAPAAAAEAPLHTCARALTSSAADTPLGPPSAATGNATRS
jgi:hypothetical protein